MLLVLAVCLCVFALAVIAALTCRERRIEKRSAPGWRRSIAKLVPVQIEEPDTDIRKHQEKLSAFPWLNRWLGRLSLATRSSLFFYQAGVTTSLGAVLLMSVTGAVVVGYLVFLRSGYRSSVVAPVRRMHSCTPSLYPVETRQTSCFTRTAIA